MSFFFFWLDGAAGVILPSYKTYVTTDDGTFITTDDGAYITID